VGGSKIKEGLREAKPQIHYRELTRDKAPQYRESKRDEAPKYMTGSLRGAKPLLQKTSPSLVREGDTGGGLVSNYRRGLI